jgi:hypothetical protein
MTYSQWTGMCSAWLAAYSNLGELSSGSEASFRFTDYLRTYCATKKITNF